MKTVNRKVAILLAMIVACTGLGTSSVFAADVQVQESTSEEQIEPRYVHILTCRSSLNISDGTAGILARYSGMSSLKKVVMTVRLQKQVSGTWLTQKTWTQTSTSITSTFNTSYSVSRGTYRVSTSFNVNDGAETATANSVTVVY